MKWPQMTTPLTARRFAVVLGIWGTALYGSLQLQHVPWPINHGICGPWGCGPPLETLIACHAGWLVFLAGPAWLVNALFPSRTLRILGIVGLLMAAGGLIGIGLVESLVWWPQASEWARPYWLQRYLFEVAMLVDFPVLQTAIVGGWFLAAESPTLRLHAPVDTVTSRDCGASASTSLSRG